jgi:hypothetical protein
MGKKVYNKPVKKQNLSSKIRSGKISLDRKFCKNTKHMFTFRGQKALKAQKFNF